MLSKRVHAEEPCCVADDWRVRAGANCVVMFRQYCCFQLLQFCSQRLCELSLSAFQLVVHLWLSLNIITQIDTYASFNTSDPVSHWINAWFCRVRFNNNFQFLFTTVQFFFPINALGFTKVHYKRFGVHTSEQQVVVRIYCDMHTICIVVRGGEVQSCFHLINNNTKATDCINLNRSRLTTLNNDWK